MTLVVGHSFPQAVRLIGDSKLTDAKPAEAVGRRRTFEGALKIIIINRALCVAWAGSQLHAMDAVRTLLTDQPSAIRDVEDRLQAVSRAAGGNVAFLVASICDAPSLAKIRGDAFVREPQPLWIGDHAAFDAFQPRFRDPMTTSFPTDAFGGRQERALGPQSPEWAARLKEMLGDRADEYEISGRMDDALRAVIADPGIASVDDHAIRVVGDWPQGFRYLSEAIHIPGMGSSASPGGYGYAVVPPIEAGTGALGVYFPLGRFGAFFHPRDLDEPQTYSAATQDAFADAVFRDHRIRIRGLGLAEPARISFPPGTSTWSDEPRG